MFGKHWIVVLTCFYMMIFVHWLHLFKAIDDLQRCSGDIPLETINWINCCNTVAIQPFIYIWSYLFWTKHAFKSNWFDFIHKILNIFYFALFYAIVCFVLVSEYKNLFLWVNTKLHWVNKLHVSSVWIPLKFQSF